LRQEGLSLAVVNAMLDSGKTGVQPTLASEPVYTPQPVTETEQPAWVTWRMGGDYCGWAPLPQYSHYDYTAGGLSYRGRHVEANFGFGLQWNQFNFSYLREMGDRPRARFRKEAEARKIFNQTTVINNYSVSRTMVNNKAHPRIINQGIDPSRVAAMRGKPVETVRIQDRRTPSPTRVPERVDARTKTLEVYRPMLPEPTPPLRGLPGAAPGARPSVPPPQVETAKAPSTITSPSPTAPAKSPRDVAPTPRVTPIPRTSVAPPQVELKKTPQGKPQSSSVKPAPGQRSGQTKPQENSSGERRQ
jgi:hypothetical protein